MKTVKPPLIIAKPCTADWSGMKGDDRRRFCEHCQRNVHNLSALTAREQRAFAKQNGDRECIAYVFAGGGKVAALSWWGRFFAPLRTALATLLPFAFSACSRTSAQPPPVLGSPAPAVRNGRVVGEQMILGKVALPTAEQDFAMLKGVEQFSIGPIGDAGIIAPREHALRRIAARPDLLAKLAREGSAAGRAYALYGMKITKSPAFAAAAAAMEKEDSPIETISGCVGSSTTLSKVVARIRKMGE